MQPSDLLNEVLRLARQEGALEGDGLRAFAEALAERAELIVRERLSRQQALEREVEWQRGTLASLEQELSWRRETAASHEQELSWRREAMASLEEQAASLRRELEWRRESLASLEQELSWRRESMASLQEENDWRRRAMEALESQLGQIHADLRTLRDEKEAASSAHDRLLQHHREVLARMRSALGAVAGARFYRWPEVRRRLAALAAELGGGGD
ncbi:MAG TPA: hypothetical protein VMX54_05665 [Vicinamibacteria bacterium]|nr:hypothetical protein [Vicinamibacteria bacterium]